MGKEGNSACRKVRGTPANWSNSVRGAIRTVIIIAAVIVVLRYLPITSNLFFLSVPENFAYDVAFGLRSPAVPSDVVIIAIVAAFLWPSFLQARHAAYVTTCLAKLNELGLAMEMYRMDYGGYPAAET